VRETLKAFWDPVGEIRKEIESDLAMISGKDIDWRKLIESAEWIGQRMEDEIDKVQRDELDQFRRREFDARSGMSIGAVTGDRMVHNRLSLCTVVLRQDY
jgi:hypothetical protein